MLLVETDGPVVAFTGHRPDKLGGWKIPNNTQKRVRLALIDELIRIRPSRAISGMALGVDQWAAGICTDFRIPFTAAIPCDDHEKSWPEHSQIFYHALLAQAADKIIVSPGPYAAWKMQRRNEWMVDHCDILVAIWDGSPGGTANCVKYAEKIGKKIRFPKWYEEPEPPTEHPF